MTNNVEKQLISEFSTITSSEVQKMNDIRVDGSELLMLVNDISGVWTDFSYSDGPGIVSARRCKSWGDRLLGIIDGGENVWEERGERA